MKLEPKIFAALVTLGFSIVAQAHHKPAPSFALKASDGNQYTLKTLGKGKPLLLIFFSAGCPHNKHGIKDANRLQSLLGEKVRIAGIANLDLRQSKLLSRAHHAKFPILSDEMAETIGKFGGSAGLDNALILPNGEVAHLWKGYDRNTLKQVETLIKKNQGPELNVDLSSFPKDRQAGCAIGMKM
jgi:peroxiredoxin